MAAAWNLEFFRRHKEDDPEESVPAQNFFDDCPAKVFSDLLAIVRAVAQGPPPQFRGGAMWRAMHDDMAGLYEARTQHSRTLYRLFCSLERTGTDVGLRGPALLMIDGRSKRVDTEIARSEYRQVLSLYTELLARTPRSVVR